MVLGVSLREKDIFKKIKHPNQANHSDGLSVAASPSLQGRACWRRYVLIQSVLLKTMKRRSVCG